jgi:hypothetical protein
MKVPGRTILCIFFSGYCLIALSQGSINKSIGIQLNPYIDEHFFTGTFFRPVYALRFSFGIKDHITFGPEFSGYYVKSRSTSYTSSTFNIGGFFRYSFLPEARIRPFAEISPYYTFSGYKVGDDVTFYGAERESSDSYFSGYIAPGVSLYTRSRKISLDLMYKFSTNDFINGQHGVFSYRVNLWF